jgi:hypothetical protein
VVHPVRTPAAVKEYRPVVLDTEDNRRPGMLDELRPGERIADGHLLIVDASHTFAVEIGEQSAVGCQYIVVASHGEAGEQSAVGRQ